VIGWFRKNPISIFTGADHNGPKTSVKDRQISRFSGRIAAEEPPMQRSKCAESGYRALSGPQTRSITLGMRSKRPKVPGHRAIAQFSGVGGIVGDPYSVRVSSSCHSKKAIVRRIGLLNGGFRPVVVSTRSADLRRNVKLAWLS
jgi:hypothetical protein